MSNFPVKNIKFNKKNDNKKLGLPGIVSQWYYKHGLFLSSYPTCASSIAIIVIMFSCYPLLNIPLPGTIPTKVILPYDEIKNNRYNNNNNNEKLINDQDNNDNQESRNYSIVKNIFNINNMTFDTPFPWTQSNPFVYIQQIIIRSSVIPWTNDLQLMDAYRAPLYEIFKLLEIVRNHESPESKINVDHICLHVENVKRPKNEQIFPEYNCLILSPANLWSQDVQNFTKDSNILNTIFQYHNLQKTKVSVTEMLFGLPMQDTGIKRYPLRSRSRIVQYALTLVLLKNDQEYLDSLRQKLTSLYPLHQNDMDIKLSVDNTNQNNIKNKVTTTTTTSGTGTGGTGTSSSSTTTTKSSSSIMYIYYPGEFKLIEFLPICTAFIMLFIYIYFSVRKIDIVKSRFILALCAVLTVLGSLMMSLGLCFFFGLTISLQSKGIFPYLVILVGLENCLVITKSIVSTDDTYDVKIRVAKGLSKEGWHISKTLLTEITILTVGLATFVPVIQEFCIFAIVGLISDFFLQMLLFSTILAMDIKHIEYTYEAKNLPKIMCYVTNDLSKRTHYKYINYRKISTTPTTTIGTGTGTQGNNNCNSNISGNISGTFHRSQSHPKLPFLDYNTMQPLHQSSPSSLSSSSTATIKQNEKKKIPKRLKLVNFWARTRFFQRAFMIWMIVWISTIVYNSGFLENFFVMDLNNQNHKKNDNNKIFIKDNHDNIKLKKSPNINHNDDNIDDDNNNIDEITDYGKLKNHKNIFNENLINENDHNNNVDDKIENNENDINLNNNTDDINKLKYPNYELNYFLSNFHWSSILKQYNISLSGKYITILPAIKLSLIIKPDNAKLLRNPNDCKIIKNFQWKALALALDPLDFNDDDNNLINRKLSGLYNIQEENLIGTTNTTPLYPKSPMEIALTIILCAISIFVLTYTMIVFYRCICTRNYAEWRSSWYDTEIISSLNSSSSEEILEGIPLQIKGHKHKIECLVSDGMYVISSCLKGQIKIWDAKDGDLINKIQRFNYDSSINDYELQQQQQQQQHQQQNISSSSSLSSSPSSPTSLISSSSLSTNINDNISPIWCLDYFDNLIAVGCASGQLEFWETPTGVLKCTSKAELKPAQGITHIHLNGDRVIVARLCGKLEFYKLGTYYRGRQIDWGFTSAYRRTHIRTGSTGSINSTGGNSGSISSGGNNFIDRDKTIKEEMICTLEEVRNAHQQPIVCMEVVESLVFTGSQDHTLKVFKLDDSTFEYSLRGHCGPITCLFVDHWEPGTGGSGSQDGLLCVWDLYTGACMYNIQAHDGSITSLACAPSYVISLGTDERVCVWERFQGNLLTTINITNSYSNLLMLTPSLLVTSKIGSLMVWDVRTGEPAREVKLDCANSQLCPKLMLLTGSSVICDYGNQLRIVRFPMVADKCN